jgi:hypothetical protein
MYQQQDTFSSRQQRELRRRIAQLRQDILRARDDLKLQPARPTTSSLVIGEANVLWQMLCELNSISLRGYGEVPEKVAQYINPLGETLTQQMYEISMLLA